MEVVSSHTRDMTLDQDQVIQFPLGLPGFEQYTRFRLFHEDKPNPTVLWLQAADEPEVMLSLVEPAVLGVDYRIELDETELATLGCAEGAPDAAAGLVVLLVMSKGGEGLNANARAPIVINPEQRLGLQKVGLRGSVVFA